MMLTSEMFKQIGEWTARDAHSLHHLGKIRKTTKAWGQAFVRFRLAQIKAESECCRRIRTLSARLSHEDRSAKQYEVFVARKKAFSKALSAFHREVRKLMVAQSNASQSLGRRRGYLRLHLYNNFVRTVQRERSRMARKTGEI